LKYTVRRALARSGASRPSGATTIEDADMGWAEALADIAEAKADPVARYLKLEHLHEVGKSPP
jgi:hypothetical protein